MQESAPRGRSRQRPKTKQTVQLRTSKIHKTRRQAGGFIYVYVFFMYFSFFLFFCHFYSQCLLCPLFRCFKHRLADYVFWILPARLNFTKSKSTAQSMMSMLSHLKPSWNMQLKQQGCTRRINRIVYERSRAHRNIRNILADLSKGFTRLRLFLSWFPWWPFDHGKISRFTGQDWNGPKSCRADQRSSFCDKKILLGGLFRTLSLWHCDQEMLTPMT